MWSEQKREFIESAARVMWAGAWADHMENEVCVYCEEGPDILRHRSVDECRGGVPCDMPHKHHPFRGTTFPGQELTEVAPPTPEYALLCAAMLLGKLEQANGCGLAVIIESARKAECASGACNQFSAAADADHRQKLGHPGEYEHGSQCDIDVAEFASAVALQALGHGVSWFDDHERFTLAASPPPSGCGHDHVSIGNENLCEIAYCRCRRADCRPSRPNSRFVVPSIEFQYEGDAL